jgi:hypothetical protein
LANLAEEAGDQVLNFVKATGLDFKIVETPFSLEIKIRKKFIKYNLGSQQKTSYTEAGKPSS